MRLTNYRATKMIPGIYYFLVVLFFLFIFLNQVLGAQFIRSNKLFYAIEALIVLSIFYTYYAGRYFEYDSEGTLLSIYTRGIILSQITNYRDKRYEVKKDSITDCKVINFLFFKKLVIHYKKNDKTKKISINVTLLSPRKVRYLKKSLSKLLQQNQHLQTAS
ncbi:MULTISPECIES: hypothetical protein [Psychroflexus]|uniref:Uncharacterized protein n=1 Tax=Psychroflexus halocasei TaxID=908615 RepID=A0A1H3ZH63_9FLAO|nr:MULTISPECIES: hypothetical protein [Psychroflexus]PJX28532.1 hypothetical protein CAP47_00090 [Psychroflexus sp. S27]SEA22731.1 hypothetical protein SAMN05421540_10470 [Psychroflexus halocasei]